MNYTVEEQKGHRKELVRALRSGKYKQDYGRLRTDVGFCCLGVATEICPMDVLRLGNNDRYRNKDSSSTTLSKSVMNYFGFNNFEGKADEFFNVKEKEHYYLTTANDSGASFEEIAQIIEDEPRGMFRT